MFANRLAKNIRRLRSWAQREAVTCYRMYDADMPEYAFAIDVYRTLEPDAQWLYVQEYAAPAEIELDAVRKRRGEVLASPAGGHRRCPASACRCAPAGAPSAASSTRSSTSRSEFYVVMEGGLKFRVNFEDYLDTGIFLDHRLTRARLREAARGQRFLNLFAYTGTATVYAAAGGAVSTTTLDMSRTYLDWAQRNIVDQRLSRDRAQFRAGRLPRVAQAGARAPPSASTWCSSTRRRFPIPSAWRACSTSSAITPSLSVIACGCWRPAA